jgi:hypothetical protein
MDHGHMLLDICNKIILDCLSLDGNKSVFFSLFVRVCVLLPYNLCLLPKVLSLLPHLPTNARDPTKDCRTHRPHTVHTPSTVVQSWHCDQREESTLFLSPLSSNTTTRQHNTTRKKRSKKRKRKEKRRKVKNKGWFFHFCFLDRNEAGKHLWTWSL